MAKHIFGKEIAEQLQQTLFCMHFGPRVYDEHHDLQCELQLKIGRTALCDSFSSREEPERPTEPA